MFLTLICRSLADTDADGKMDINEFSIACKLINLKLRGFEVPKSLPPSLLASLRTVTPPAIPPLPNPALISSKPVVPQPPIIQAQPLMSQAPVVPIGGIPTGVVPPMQTAPAVQPLLGGIPNMAQHVPSMAAVTQPLIGAPPLGIAPPLGMKTQPVGVQPVVPQMQPGYRAPGVPLVSGAPLVTGVPAMPVVPPIGTAAPMVPGVVPVPTAVLAPLTGGSTMSPLGALPVVAAMPPAGPGATSTPRASVTSLDRAASIESP